MEHEEAVWNAMRPEEGFGLKQSNQYADIQGCKTALTSKAFKAFDGPDDFITAPPDEKDIPDVESVPYSQLGVNVVSETECLPGVFLPTPSPADHEDSFVASDVLKKPCTDYWEGLVVPSTDKALFKFAEDLPKLRRGPFITGCIASKDLEPEIGQYEEGKHYDVLGNVGSGSYGDVDRCLDKKTGKGFIRKAVDAREMRSSEAIAPRIVDHENIVKLHGLILQPDLSGKPARVQLLMEDGGMSLSHFMHKRCPKGMKEEQIRNLTKQWLRGLECLERYKINHLDIKPENLVIKEVDGKLIAKITDFGAAMLPHEAINFIGWTYEYMAPECSKFALQKLSGLNLGMTQAQITGKADVFALALVVLFMYQGDHVLVKLITKGNHSYFSEKQRQDLMLPLLNHNARNKVLVKQLIPDRASLGMREVLQKMLEHDPLQRYSATQAREHLEDFEEQMRRQTQSEVFSRTPEPVAVPNAAVGQGVLTKLEAAPAVQATEQGPVHHSHDRVKQRLKARLLARRTTPYHSPAAGPRYSYAPAPGPSNMALTPVEELKKLSLAVNNQASAPPPGGAGNSAAAWHGGVTAPVQWCPGYRATEAMQTEESEPTDQVSPDDLADILCEPVRGNLPVGLF